MMNKYLLMLLFLIVGNSAWGQKNADIIPWDSTATTVLRIWEGPYPKEYNSGGTFRTEPFEVAGRRYGGYEIMRRSDILIPKDIQKRMAPQTMEEPAVFLKYGVCLTDTLHDCFFGPRDWDTIQVFSSREFGSLADMPVPFNFIDIAILDEWSYSLCVYKPGSELMKKSKETITLAELQKKLAPETRDRPCIFFYDVNLIGDDFDKYRVPKARAVYIDVIPSEYFRELKGTGDEFYLLDILPFEPSIK